MLELIICDHTDRCDFDGEIEFGVKDCCTIGYGSTVGIVSMLWNY